MPFKGLINKEHVREQLEKVLEEINEGKYQIIDGYATPVEEKYGVGDGNDEKLEGYYFSFRYKEIEKLGDRYAKV